MSLYYYCFSISCIVVLGVLYSFFFDNIVYEFDSNSMFGREILLPASLTFQKFLYLLLLACKYAANSFEKEEMQPSLISMLL